MDLDSQGYLFEEEGAKHELTEAEKALFSSISPVT